VWWLSGLGQYVALRALGEPDAFPAADLVLRKAAAGDGPPLTARALAARAEAWRPWRGYAVFHLWGAAAASAGHASRRQKGE
jgi:AraC family transcriptional regulator of adaptative response / DNA-3-methyladenine glycosylase II